MVYKVVITPVAEHHLEMYVSYTLFTFKYKEYARAIIKDAKATKRRLAKIAFSIDSNHQFLSRIVQIMKQPLEILGAVYNI